MMGEGKVDVFPESVWRNFGLSRPEPSCVICSRISLDIENLDNVPLENMDLANYMSTRAVPGKEISYAQFIAGEKYSASVKLNSLQDYKIYDLDENGKFTVKDSGADFLPFERSNDVSSQTAVLFSQITGPASHFEVLRNDLFILGGVTGGSFFSKPLALVSRAAYTGPGLFALAIGGVVQLGSVSYNQAITASYCGNLETSSNPKEGCSLVRTINYDVEEILSYCSVIESIS